MITVTAGRIPLIGARDITDVVTHAFAAQDWTVA